MFEAEINEGRLIDCMESITAITDMGVLNIVADGWKVNMVDPANVALISLELQSDAFDKFEFETKGSEEGIKIGIDFGSLLGMLRLWEEGKKVELKLDEHAEKLFVSSDIFDYSISLLKLSSLRREPKKPRVNFSVQVIIETEEFRRAIRAMERLSDTVMLGVDGEQFYMEAKDESNMLRSVLRKVFPLKKEPGNFHTRYSLEYLSVMCSGMARAQNLTLNFGSDSPLQIWMDFDVGAGNKKVSYLLAPLIDQE